MSAKSKHLGRGPCRRRIFRLAPESWREMWERWLAGCSGPQGSGAGQRGAQSRVTAEGSCHYRSGERTSPPGAGTKAAPARDQPILLSTKGGTWPRYGAWPATVSLGAWARQVFRLPRGYFRIRWRPLKGSSDAAECGGVKLAVGRSGWLASRARRCWGASLGPRSTRRRATRRGLCPRRPPSTSRPRARTPSMMVRNTECGGLPRPRPGPRSSSGPAGGCEVLPRTWTSWAGSGPERGQRCSVEGGRAVWIRRARIETVVCSPLDRFPFCSAVFLCGLGATDAPGCFPSGCFPAPEPRGSGDAVERCKLVYCNLADPMRLAVWVEFSW